MELSGSEAPATPSPETPASEVPAETPESPAPVVPEVPAEALYDLPDGRKVDAATLQREWKENFLPDYTRKSQKIAEIERGKDVTKPSDEPVWKNPDYVPGSYAEVIEIAKAAALDEIKTSAEREQQRVAAIHSRVDAELAEVKQLDPKVDENALFLHANKYGFQNLKAAHKNMSDLKAATLDAEQRTLKNIKTREADPISTGPSGGMGDDDGYDPNAMSNFNSAAEYLASLKGKK